MNKNIKAAFEHHFPAYDLRVTEDEKEYVDLYVKAMYDVFALAYKVGRMKY